MLLTRIILHFKVHRCLASITLTFLELMSLTSDHDLFRNKTTMGFLLGSISIDCTETSGSDALKHWKEGSVATLSLMIAAYFPTLNHDDNVH